MSDIDKTTVSYEILTRKSDPGRHHKAIETFFNATEEDQDHSYKVMIVKKSDAANKEIDLKRHEFKNAVGRVARVVDLLESGYRFDDQRAEKNIEYLKKAADRLEEFGVLLNSVFSRSD